MLRTTFKSMLAALALGGLAVSANAAPLTNGTASATFNVTLTIKPNCVVSATALNFGTAGVLSTALTASSALSVLCTNTTPYNIGLDAGTVPNSTVANRLMAGTASGNTGSTVAFELYLDAAEKTIWGSQQNSANIVTGTGTGVAQSIPIYGQVPAQATPAPDTYQTTVTATVYF
jgi:spore coat protein U-like protein